MLKAQCVRTGKYVAIKCMKNKFESMDQVRADSHESMMNYARWLWGGEEGVCREEWRPPPRGARRPAANGRRPPRAACDDLAIPPPPRQVNSLREIQALRRLSPHAHVIRLLEVLYDQPTGRLALVFELMVGAGGGGQGGDEGGCEHRRLALGPPFPLAAGPAPPPPRTHPRT